MNLWFVIPAVLSCVLVLYLLGQYNSREAERDWEDLQLSARALDEVDAVAEQFGRDGVVLDHLHTAATSHRAATPEEAKRYLAVACRFVEGAAPDRLARLWAMGRLARMASAVLPVAPVPPAAFQLLRLRGFTAVTATVHQVLVSTAERLAFRTTVLAVAVRLVLGCLRRSNSTVQRNPALDRAWATFAAGVSDWKVLDREHLVTLRAVIASLAVERA